jgi:2-haloacid dehalogenase
MDWNPRYLYRKIFEDPGAMERFLEEVGFGAWNEEQDRGRPFAEGVAVLIARFPDYRTAIEAFHHRWEETIAGEIAGSVEILAALRDAGYPLYGLSNWSAETFAVVRHRYPFFSWFDAIVLSGEEKVCKPDPGLFNVLLERSGRPAGECVFIDDSLPNVTAARAMGFQVVHFRSPEQLREELTDRGIFA